MFAISDTQILPQLRKFTAGYESKSQRICPLTSTANFIVPEILK